MAALAALSRLRFRSTRPKSDSVRTVASAGLSFSIFARKAGMSVPGFTFTNASVTVPGLRSSPCSVVNGSIDAESPKTLPTE